MELQLINPKYYQQAFNISHNTAKAWYKDDLAMIGRKRMTLQQFNFIYMGVDRLQVPEVYTPQRVRNRPKKTDKDQHRPIRTKSKKTA